VTLPPVQLPTPLLCQLTDLKDLLATNGAVVLRTEENRHPCYRLRVRLARDAKGHRKMLSITLASQEEALAVANLIATWRAERLAGKVAQRVARQEKLRKKRLEQLERREELLALRLLTPKGNQRRVQKEYAQLLRTDPLAASLYVLGREYAKERPERSVRGESAPGKQNPVSFELQPVQAKVRGMMAERRQRLGLVATMSCSSKELRCCQQ
jgi:hypothetical protein